MFGGSGEIRTHGAISDSAVFKTAAISRALPRFLNKMKVRYSPRIGSTCNFLIAFLLSTFKIGGDDWSRTSSAFRAADLQSTGVTNFPTSPFSNSTVYYSLSTWC